MNFTRGDVIALKIINNLATNPRVAVQEAKGNKDALALFGQFIGEAMKNPYLQNYTVTLTLRGGFISTFDLIDGEMITRKSPPA